MLITLRKSTAKLALDDVGDSASCQVAIEQAVNFGRQWPMPGVVSVEAVEQFNRVKNLMEALGNQEAFRVNALVQDLVREATRRDNEGDTDRDDIVSFTLAEGEDWIQALRDQLGTI